MLNQERGIFKPSLKSHSLLTNPSVKRYSFLQQPFKQKPGQYQTQNNTRSILYLTLDQGELGYPNKFFSNQTSNRPFTHHDQTQKDIQNPSPLTVARFDPILPKFLFKRSIIDFQLPQPQLKHISNQIIQKLKVKNVNYPFEVQKMFREAEEKKALYKKSIQKPNSNSMEVQNFNAQNQDPQGSYKTAFQTQTSKGLRKIPFTPLMGTDGQIFWSFAIDKIVLWRYKMQDFANPQVFCILNFENNIAPVSAVYATQIQSSIYKYERTILISVAFFDQLQFFSFNIQKYEKEFVFKYEKSERTEQDFAKYVQKIMVRVNSNFFIQKILIQNIPNHSSANKYLRPLVIFTDGGADIEIVDLENLAAYKSHSQFDLFYGRKRKQENKLQNQIIKLLHCRDQNNPMIHYAFVLRKQTKDEEVEPKTFAQKIRSFFYKKFEKKEKMILAIYEWNQTELKNNTIWKKLWSPQRIKKIKEISSKDLELRLKQNFFDFYRLNVNNQFIIADISLIDGNGSSKIFQPEAPQGCNLKVSFINGTSVLISNFRTLTFVSKVKVNPYIEKSVPISSCQYQNYRKLLDKGKYLQNSNQVKNKFNLYIYEPIESEKDIKYARIDPVVSECNGLTICQGKIIYEDEMQILYDFKESTARKRIYQLKERRNFHKKSFMIFEKSFITIVETPNVAENFLLMAHLQKKYPDFKDKIKEYANSLFVDLTEEQKINLIENIFELIIQIQSSGKIKEANTQSKVIFNELVKGFYAREKTNSTDDTTYIEQRETSSQVLQDAYAYEIELSKLDYEHFVEYLLGVEVAAKEKQYLKNMNSSYSGKTFSLKVTEYAFQFMMELLVQHGIKEVSDRHVRKTNNMMEISSGLNKYISESVKNSTDQKYLTSIFAGMFQIKESFLMTALSKFIMELIQPILNVSYKDFHKNKALNIIIGQKLEEIKNFLERFIQHCSFKNIKSKIFQETVLFCKSVQNSLPKISLILRLFEALSEVEYYNISLQTSHQIFCNQVNLKNLLFKVGTKGIFQRITVQSLFDENAILLDQIEEKLPELNNIKYLRFYLGWKKINSQIIENSEVEKQKPSTQQNTWMFNFLKKEVPQKKNKTSLLLENQEQKISEKQAKLKEEFLSIQKALNEYSYEDFEKFFIAKNQYTNFANILLSKIYYLQLNYLELKNRYNFTEEGYESFNAFAQTQIKTGNQQFENKQNLPPVKKQTQKPNFNSFLNYEEKVCGHQNYLRIYSLIKFLNEKILAFFDKTVSIYKTQCQKVSKELLSTSVSNQTHRNQQRYQQNSSKYQIMVQEVQKLVDLLISQGSELMKNEVSKRLKGDSLLQCFIRKTNHDLDSEAYRILGLNVQNKKFSTFQEQNNFLVKNNLIEERIQQSSQMRLQEQRRKMYEQKINEQISGQLKGQFVAKNDTSWMRNHNYKSNETFKYQNL